MLCFGVPGAAQGDPPCYDATCDGSHDGQCVPVYCGLYPCPTCGYQYPCITPCDVPGTCCVRGGCIETLRASCDAAGGSFVAMGYSCGAATCVDAAEYLAALGPGSSNPNRVRAFLADGSLVADLFAYGAASWGANVSRGDVLGQGTSQILTGPGPGPGFGSQVRAFDATGTPLPSINFYAYGTQRYGVNVSAANLDGDYPDEILTGPGPGAVFGPHVRGFDRTGTISAIKNLSFFAYATLSYGVNVSGFARPTADPIFTGPGPGPSFGPDVRGFTYGAGGVAPLAGARFWPFSNPGYGARVAGEESRSFLLAAAHGPGPALDAEVRGFGWLGAIVPLAGCDVAPFPSLYGAHIAVGDLNGAVWPEIAAGPGPDPATAALLQGYHYDETRALLAPLNAAYVAFSGTAYGIDVGVGNVVN